ncbi:hypothetical protein SLS63_003885 [Diaporthe eres]|uniref:Uncharacterized protein n=1 Tax=Diaporthe eres TaxID=83184 RepID=A0ABR1PFL1_DIAER
MNPAPLASDTSSAEDATWQVERQILLDEVEDLKNKYSDMEKKLRQAERQSDRKISDLQEILTFTRNQAASQVEEATEASEDKIQDLQMRNIALLRRANEAEKKEAEWKERATTVCVVQPRRFLSRRRRSDPTALATGIWCHEHTTQQEGATEADSME